MLILEISIVAVLIVLNGLLALSELAIVSSRPARLRAMIERNVIPSRRALALASDTRQVSVHGPDRDHAGRGAVGCISGATLGLRSPTGSSVFGLSEQVAEPLAVAIVVALIPTLP